MAYGAWKLHCDLHTYVKRLARSREEPTVGSVTRRQLLTVRTVADPYHGQNWDVQVCRPNCPTRLQAQVDTLVILSQQRGSRKLKVVDPRAGFACLNI